MFYNFIIIIFLLLIFNLIYTFTKALGLLGFIVITMYFGFTLFIFHKKYYEPRPIMSHLKSMGVILAIPFILSFFVVSLGINNDKYNKLKDSYTEGDYQKVVSSINSLQRHGWSFYRADKLKDKAIKEWISECNKSEDSNCKEEIFDDAIIDTDLERAAIITFGYNKEKYIDITNLKADKKKLQSAQEQDSPYIGMDVEYIGATNWGPPDEQYVFYDSTHGRDSTAISYYWYNCEGDTLYKNTVTSSSGKVITVTSGDKFEGCSQY